MEQQGTGALVSESEGVVTALLERIEEQHLPRAIDLQAKVGGGAVLDDMDIAFLERVFADCRQITTIDDAHPDLKTAAARVMAIYLDITSQALKNEERAAQAVDDKGRL